jgi:hypothetical protein
MLMIEGWGGGGGMKFFTYTEGGYENFSIGFWEGLEICTWNLIYPPPPSSNYFMTAPLFRALPVRKSQIFQFIPLACHFLFSSSFVSMHCSQAKSTAETCLKCICVHINPAPNSSQSEDSRQKSVARWLQTGLSNFLSRSHSVNIYYK